RTTPAIPQSGHRPHAHGLATRSRTTWSEERCAGLPGVGRRRVVRRPSLWRAPNSVAPRRCRDSSTVVDDDGEGVDLGGGGRADRACGGAGRGGRVGERAVTVDGDGAPLRGSGGPAVGAGITVRVGRD